MKGRHRTLHYSCLLVQVCRNSADHSNTCRITAHTTQSHCDWNQLRRRSCGWAPITNCSSSTFMFQSCQHLSRLSTQHVTWPESGHWQPRGLTMSDNVTAVSAVCRSTYYQQRQLRRIARSLSDDDKKTFVSYRLECRPNALLYGNSGGLIQRLQSVQNASGRLVTRARRRYRITPVLRQLHWLSVKQGIDFKLAVLVYKSPRSAVSLPVGRLLTRHWGGTLTPSHRTFTRTVPRTQSQIGYRIFTAAGLRLWSSCRMRSDRKTLLMKMTTSLFKASVRTGCGAR